jgi:hypothetical protein
VPYRTIGHTRDVHNPIDEAVFRRAEDLKASGSGAAR